MGKEKMYYEEVGYDFDPPFYRTEDKPVVTNGDKIRSMTDEELAAWLEDRLQLPSNGLWLDWLKQEIKE